MTAFLAAQKQPVPMRRNSIKKSLTLPAQLWRLNSCPVIKTKMLSTNTLKRCPGLLEGTISLGIENVWINLASGESLL